MDRRNFLNVFGRSAMVAGAYPLSRTGQVLAKSSFLPAQEETGEKQAGAYSLYSRSFLEGLGERYLEALVAHNPAAVPFSGKVIFAENDQRLQPGEASWLTIDRLGRYRHYFADPEMGHLGLIANVYSNGSGCIIVLRLRVEDNLIVEAEQFISHDPMGAALYEKLGKPDPIWLEPIPPAQRQSREALEAVAYMYFQALERNDGAGIYPFREDCERIEHGRSTVRRPKNEGYGHAATAVDFVTLAAKAQYELGMMAFVTRIRDRRAAVVDIERGAVLGQGCYDFDGLLEKIRFDSGTIWEIPPYFRTPRTHQAAEAFKVMNGSFRYIEMTFLEVPFSTRQVVPGHRMTVQLTYAPSAPPATPIRTADRAGLTAITAKVLDAIIACCPHRLPLATNCRYTENGVPVVMGEGIWKSVMGLRGYGITLADPETGQAGWFGALDEHGLFAMLALRLKLEGGLISEIEAIISRPELPAKAGGISGSVQTMFMPLPVVDLNRDGFNKPAPALTRHSSVKRGELTEAVRRYFEGFTHKDGSLPPLAPGCIRRENGVMACNNLQGPLVDKSKPEFRLFTRNCREELNLGFLAAVEKLRSNRTLVVDESMGLALDLALFDNPATTKSVTVEGVGEVNLPSSFGMPWTDLHAQLFKMEGDKIIHIEGLVRRAPYGQKSGWES
jgi:hypothetical protein